MFKPVNVFNNKKGFTLIELLVVIAIIGILATIIVASFTSAQQRSRDARRKSDLDALKKALELAKADSTGSAYYPNAVTAATLVTAPRNYIQALPPDPTDGVGTYEATYTPVCPTPTTCNSYTIRACLENVNDSQRDKDASGNPVADNAAGDACPAVGRISYTLSNP